jgi:hypothetical protein
MKEVVDLYEPDLFSLESYIFYKRGANTFWHLPENREDSTSFCELLTILRNDISIVEYRRLPKIDQYDENIVVTLKFSKLGELGEFREFRDLEDRPGKKIELITPTSIASSNPSFTNEMILKKIPSSTSLSTSLTTSLTKSSESKEKYILEIYVFKGNYDKKLNLTKNSKRKEHIVFLLKEENSSPPISPTSPASSVYQVQLSNFKLKSDYLCGYEIGKGKVSSLNIKRKEKFKFILENRFSISQEINFKKILDVLTVNLRSCERLKEYDLELRQSSGYSETEES